MECSVHILLADDAIWLIDVMVVFVLVLVVVVVVVCVVVVVVYGHRRHRSQFPKCLGSFCVLNKVIIEEKATLSPYQARFLDRGGNSFC